MNNDWLKDITNPSSIIVDSYGDIDRDATMPQQQWVSDIQDDVTTNEIAGELNIGGAEEQPKVVNIDTPTTQPQQTDAQPQQGTVEVDDDNKTRRLREEGFRSKIYKDTRGFLTVGYGHKLTKEEIKSGKYRNGISKEEALKLYEQDEAREQARLRKHLPSYDKQPKNVKNVLTDMAYNMGGNFLKEWKHFKAQIERGDYKGAAENIRHSRYYKQVSNRAERNAKLLEALGRK